MIKFFVYILIGSFVLIMFFTPARNYMNSLFLRDKAQLKEEQRLSEQFQDTARELKKYRKP